MLAKAILCFYSLARSGRQSSWVMKPRRCQTLETYVYSLHTYVHIIEHVHLLWRWGQVQPPHYQEGAFSAGRHGRHHQHQARNETNSFEENFIQLWDPKELEIVEQSHHGKFFQEPRNIKLSRKIHLIHASPLTPLSSVEKVLSVGRLQELCFNQLVDGIPGLIKPIGDTAISRTSWDCGSWVHPNQFPPLWCLSFLGNYCFSIPAEYKEFL